MCESMEEEERHRPKATCQPVLLSRCPGNLCFLWRAFGLAAGQASYIEIQNNLRLSNSSYDDENVNPSPDVRGPSLRGTGDHFETMQRDFLFVFCNEPEASDWSFNRVNYLKRLNVKRHFICGSVNFTETETKQPIWWSSLVHFKKKYIMYMST